MDYTKVSNYIVLELHAFIPIHKQMLKQICHWTDYLFIYLLTMVFIVDFLRFSEANEAFFPYLFSETS